MLIPEAISGRRFVAEYARPGAASRTMSASSWESILTKTPAASPGRRPRGTLVARIRVVDRLCGAFDC